MTRSPSPIAIRHVVGTMTGTSIDGIDVALVRINDRGLDMRCELVRHLSRPLGCLATSLRHFADQVPMSSGAIAQLAQDFGELHATVIAELCESAPPFDLISVHGQTVFHQPPLSWQLINPEPIAQRFGVPVVFDLRQADLAAGGCGAPITPLADWIMYRDESRSRAIINLGGFCNATILPCEAAAHQEHKPGRCEAKPRVPPLSPALDTIRGFDICACNQLLDQIARETLDRAFDQDGRAAAAGSVDVQSHDALLDLLSAQASAQRSLGTGDELSNWVHQTATTLTPNDLARTAVEAIASCIAQRLAAFSCEEIVLAGGGGRNRALANALERASQTPITMSDSIGIPIDGREAMAIAVLGALCADGVPITLPQVTGCAAARVAGRWVFPREGRMR